MTKLKPFSGKVRQSDQNFLNQNLGVGSFLENGFEATFSSKTNVLSIWKKHFSIFWKCLSDEVETIFRESEAKRSKLFKSKFGRRKFVRKWFWSYLSSKANVLSVWKNHISVFCKCLSDEVETAFWEKEGKRSTLFKSKFSNMQLLSKWFWSYIKFENECFECLKRAFLSFFAKFWVTRLKPFSGKLRQSIRIYLNQNLVI